MDTKGIEDCTKKGKEHTTTSETGTVEADRSVIRKHPVEMVMISINMEETGRNIKRLIQASGYTMKDIMLITGISSQQAIYKWYRGESIPSIETQLILCKVLGLQITELLVIEGDFND